MLAKIYILPKENYVGNVIMSYVNLQAHGGTVSGVNNLLAKLVSLFLKLWHAYWYLHNIKNSCVATSDWQLFAIRCNYFI